MIIRSLELLGYRNYKEEAFNFATGTNVFYGKNAQGKTNALEAIFFCATGKSHRGTKDRDIIGFGEKEGHIKLIAEKNGVPHRIDVHLKKGKRKGIAIDGIPLKKAVDLFGTVNVIIFAPEDLSIIKNSPSERRSFIDVALCQLDKIYTHNLINYNKVIIQKNKLLKQIEKNENLKDTIYVWNEQLIKFAVPIIKRRREFIEELGEITKKTHAEITNGEELLIKYEPSCSEEEIAEKIASGMQKEIAVGAALYGPHRDDLSFIVDGIDAREFGSQGQQRTVALSLKLAEIELVKAKINDTPVLLLDDVLSELDDDRQKRLLSCLEGIQTIITCTGLDEFTLNNFNIDKTFFITNGSIKKD